jgi:hypothetical protein
VRGLSIGIGMANLAVAGGYLRLLLQGPRPVGGRHLPPGAAPNPRAQQRRRAFMPIAFLVFLANAIWWLLRGFGLVH